MNRNQAGQTEVPRINHYSRINPPPSGEVALKRIDGLSVEVTQIEVELDHADPEFFQTEEGYQHWRHRATKALGHKKSELVFLERWVREQEYVARRFVEPVRGSAEIHRDLRTDAQSIRNRVADLVREIRGSYTPCYTAVHEVESMPVANERLTQLARVRHQLQAAFAEVTAAWTSHRLRRGDLSGVKSPLQKILMEIEIETSVVREYVQLQHTSFSSDWKAVCARALERAVSEGFVLTEPEKVVLEQLKTWTG